MILTDINEGTHSFKFPYVGYDNDFGLCSVDLHIGGPSGHTMVIVITQESTSNPHLESFIENVCTHLKRWLEDNMTRIIDPEQVTWYQVLPYYNNGIWKEVTMTWDRKQGLFHTAKWKEVQPLKEIVIEG